MTMALFHLPAFNAARFQPGGARVASGVPRSQISDLIICEDEASPPGVGAHAAAFFQPESLKSVSRQSPEGWISVFHAGLLANVESVPSSYSTYSVALSGGASLVAIPLGFST